MAEIVEPREKAVPKYFRKTPEKPKAPDQPDYPKHGAKTVIGAILALIGLIMFFAVFDNITFSSLCIGPILLALGGFLVFSVFSARSTTKDEYEKKMKEHAEAIEVYNGVYEHAEPKPSDQQMDEWLQGDRERIRTDALKKLDLEASQVVRDPIEVIGPANKADLQVGKDNVIRFSKYDLVTVYLTDYHLAAYKCTLDMAHGTQTDESTQEYHYKDVVSVATQTAGSDLFAVMLNGEHKSIASYQKFQLAVASGDRIEVAIAFPQIDDIIKEGKLAPTGADEAIRVIRARLREMKGGVQV